MSWQINDVVEVGYAIPSLLVTPPLHFEELRRFKQSVYANVIVRMERSRYGPEDDTIYNTLLPSDTSLFGELKYSTQLSLGFTSDNNNLLSFQSDLVAPADYELEWVIIKEPIRVVGGQIQLIVFNDGTDALTIDGYEIQLGDTANSRVRSD